MLIALLNIVCWAVLVGGMLLLAALRARKQRDILVKPTYEVVERCLVNSVELRRDLSSNRYMYVCTGCTDPKHPERTVNTLSGGLYWPLTRDTNYRELATNHRCPTPEEMAKEQGPWEKLT